MVDNARKKNNKNKMNFLKVLILVDFLKSLSNIEAYKLANAFLYKKSNGTIKLITGGDKSVHTFPLGISPKLYVIT